MGAIAIINPSNRVTEGVRKAVTAWKKVQTNKEQLQRAEMALAFAVDKLQRQEKLHFEQEIGLVPRDRRGQDRSNLKNQQGANL